MIGASLAFALVLHATLLPVDTALTSTVLHPSVPVVDSRAGQPSRFDPTRFDTATAGALQIIFDGAAARGIPISPLVSQAYRGSAMGASSSKILNVVREKYAAMLDARAALGDGATASELDSGADALRAGVDGKTLVAIRATRPGAGSAVSALVVLADLVKRGIPATTARDAVTSLARVSKSDDHLNALQQLVAKNAERGPGMAEGALARYLRANAPGNVSPASPKPVTRPPGPPDAP
jgi:hypothetical protein